MKRFFTLAIVVGVVAFSVYSIMLPHPETLENRYLRGFLDGVIKCSLKFLLALDRLGLVSSPADSLRGFYGMKGDGNNSLQLRFSKDDRVAVAKDFLANVPVLIFKPKTKIAEDASAVVIYFHGGGFVLCNVWTHYLFTQKLALDADIVVISVDYRLAPEYAFPSAIEDASRVTVAVFNEARRLGIDPAKVFIAGDSAGGNLAATVATELSDRFVLRGIILLSPWLQMVNTGLPSHQQYRNIFTIDLDWFLMQYAGVSHYYDDISRSILANSHVPCELRKETEQYFQLLPPRGNSEQGGAISCEVGKTEMTNEAAFAAIQSLVTSKRAWPFLADDAHLSKLAAAPVLIQYTEFDPLRDEAILFADRLRILGVDVQISYLPGALHGEPVYIFTYGIVGETQASKKGTSDVVNFIKNQQ